MSCHLPTIVQFMPDWMVGKGLGVASWGAVAGAGIMGMIAETPSGLIAALIMAGAGAYVAHVQRSATRERDRIAIAELRAEVEAMKNYNHMLASHVGSDELKQIRADANL